MTILVTGGAGFIGSNFVQMWLDTRDEPLINLDKLTYAGSVANVKRFAGNERYQFVQGDIRDRAVVGEILRGRRPRAIVNFAAESHVDRSIYQADDFIRTNVVGTFDLLETARTHWQGLERNEQSLFRFLHVSTDEVYGSLGPEDEPFTELDRYQPNSPYAATKAASDHLVRAWHQTYGLPVLTTNCCNNFGPYHYPEKLIPLIIHNALAGRPLPVYGDGEQRRDWLYVADYCCAIVVVLEAGRSGETYNVGGSSERTNLQVVKAVCGCLDELKPREDGSSYFSQVSFVKDRPGHDRRYAICARKIGDELGWRPQESFELGIRKTVAWYLENGDWLASVTDSAYQQWIDKQYS